MDTIRELRDATKVDYARIKEEWCKTNAQIAKLKAELAVLAAIRDALAPKFEGLSGSQEH